MGKKILVVEDSRPQALAAKLSLTKGGYEVLLAEDGQDGYEKATGEPFDLIVTDINMPRMDGYQMCARLKETQITRDVPIVITTTRNSAEDVIKGLEVGAINFITKPFEHDKLVEKVTRILETFQQGGGKRDKSLKQLRDMMQGTSEKTQIFEVLFEAFGNVIECQAMGIMLVDQGGSDLLFIMSQVPLPETTSIDFSDRVMAEFNVHIPYQNPIMESDCRKFIVVQNPDSPDLAALRFKSHLFSPLLSRGSVLGEIGIAHQDAGKYTEDDMKMLCALSLQASESLKGLDI